MNESEQNKKNDPEEHIENNNDVENIPIINIDESILDSMLASTEEQEALRAEAADWKDKFVRLAAEFDNYKRRTRAEAENFFKYSGERILEKLLPVIDDLERSLQHSTQSSDPGKITEGVRLIYDKFMKVLNEQGLKKMESVGMPFDVNFHDALTLQISNDHPPHTVINEIQPGYLYKDKVIRHAQVIVSAEPETENTNEQELKEENK